MPALYLRGISTGDFQEALAAILGKDAPNLSPGVISRLTGEWQQDYDRWQRRDLSARRYVYIWADGVYLQARMEPQAECMLVILGATPEGKKELVGFQVGVRESAQSWRELLVDIKARGLAVPHRQQVAGELRGVAALFGFQDHGSLPGALPRAAKSAARISAISRQASLISASVSGVTGSEPEFTALASWFMFWDRRD